MDLFRQFPGRRQDQGPHSLAFPLAEPLQDGKGKGRRLARPGLGEPHYIPPCQDRRDRLLLDGGRVNVI